MKLSKSGWIVLVVLLVVLYLLYTKFGGALTGQAADLGEPQVASYYSNIYYGKNRPTANRTGTKGPIAETLFDTKA